MERIPDIVSGIHPKILGRTGRPSGIYINSPSSIFGSVWERISNGGRGAGVRIAAGTEESAAELRPRKQAPQGKQDESSKLAESSLPESSKLAESSLPESSKLAESSLHKITKEHASSCPEEVRPGKRTPPGEAILIIPLHYKILEKK